MGMSGPDPITPRDIRDWCDMTGTVLRREECSILIDMDGSYRASWAEETAANAEREKQHQALSQGQKRRR
jgi:hypothetical protein